MWTLGTFTKSFKHLREAGPTRQGPQGARMGFWVPGPGIIHLLLLQGLATAQHRDQQPGQADSEPIPPAPAPLPSLSALLLFGSFLICLKCR